MKKFFVIITLALLSSVPNLTVLADAPTPTHLPTDTPEYASNVWLDTPVKGAYERCNVGYGEVNIAGGQDFHNGVDLACGWPEGTPVLAASSGTVVFADWFPTYWNDQAGHGNTVVILHPNGVYSYYAHLVSFVVYPGQYVDTGQIIGFLGETGAATGVHLHFAIASYPPETIEQYDCWNDQCWLDPDWYLAQKSPQTVIFEPTQTQPIIVVPSATPTIDLVKMFPTPTLLSPPTTPTPESNWLKEIVGTFIDLPTPTPLPTDSPSNIQQSGLGIFFELPTPTPLPTDTPTVFQTQPQVSFGEVAGFPNKAVFAPVPFNAIPINIKVSHYYPWYGGTNCYDYRPEIPDWAQNYPNADKSNGWCWSSMNSGQRWEEFVGYAAACPSEFPTGTKVYAGGQEFMCLDTGGGIVTEDNAYWIDFMSYDDIGSWGEIVTGYILYP